MDKNAGRSKVEGMSNRLFLLDGMALVYRAHFAFANRPILTSAGVNTSALFGFANTLLEIQEKHRPSHIAAAFDTPEPTARHQEYPAYKAQRETMPEALQAALPAVERLCEAFRIPIIKCPGHEADDIAGTLARQAEAEEFETYMVTPDKDFAQLVSPSTFLLKPGRKGDAAEIWKLPEVLADWGVERADQVRDVLGLWGDASDNIPGVPGIGQKTASKLILQYSSVENLLEHLGELKGKMRETLKEHREAVLLAKRLATINRKAPISIRLSDLASRPPDEDALRRLCIEFEFNSIGRRLFGPAFKAGRGWKATKGEKSQPPGALLRTAANVEHEYVCVQTELARRELAARLADQKIFCFDTETTGLDAKEAKILGLAFAFEARRAFYVPILPYDKAGRAIADGEINTAALEVFRDALENPAIDKVGHNLKYDLGVLLWNGLRVQGKILDTMLLHCLIEPELRHGMDFLAEHYLGYSPIPITSLIGQKGTEQRLMTTVSLDRLTEYAAEDADITWQLYQTLQPKLKEAKQESVYFDIEEPLIRILAEMEYEGIRLDSATLRQFSTQLGKQAQQLERSIYEMAGTAFNLNSPKQLGQVLFGRLQLAENPKKTKTGQYSTNEQVLASLAPKHEIVRKILDYRAATKLKSTYADTLPEAIFPASGRVHTTFHQSSTVTGRLNSQRPSLQNIPIRTESGQEIRRAFVPRNENYLLMSADYSQIELRIIASLSEGQRNANCLPQQKRHSRSHRSQSIQRAIRKSNPRNAPQSQNGQLRHCLRNFRLRPLPTLRNPTRRISPNHPTILQKLPRRQKLHRPKPCLRPKTRLCPNHQRPPPLPARHPFRQRNHTQGRRTQRHQLPRPRHGRRPNQNSNGQNRKNHRKTKSKNTTTIASPRRTNLRPLAQRRKRSQIHSNQRYGKRPALKRASTS